MIPKPKNTEPREIGDTASAMKEEDAMGASFEKQDVKVPTSNGGEGNTSKPVSTPGNPDM